jgi:hypothetical protein
MVKAMETSDHKHWDSTLDLATIPLFTNNSVLYNANNQRFRSNTK